MYVLSDAFIIRASILCMVIMRLINHITSCINENILLVTAE